MLFNPEFNFEIALPIREHAQVILKWRNDPQTLKNSFHSTPKVEETFFNEYVSTYFCFPALPPLFVLQGAERVAFLRFEPCEDFAASGAQQARRCCLLSINISPMRRGKGLGSALLRAIQPWIKQQGFEALYSEVKSENQISRKAFTNAGFQELPEVVKVVDDRLEFLIVRYVVDLVPSKNKSSTLVIAEAGSNWRMGGYKRDLSMAKTLIEIAAEAQADVVKFQVFRPETIYVKNAGALDSLQKEGVEAPMESLFADLMMPYEMIAELYDECRRMNIDFMATPFSIQDFKAVDPYVIRHKIASYELNHPHLLALAAKSGKPLLLSTGASTQEEIAWAVNTFYANGGHDLTLLQCTACYPAPPTSMNLNVLSWLQSRFKVKVGLSDHSLNAIAAPVSAVALGATVIEKHFTMDRRLPGPDHSFAVMPHELKIMVAAIREAEQMRGSYMKSVDSAEHELRDFARRGIQALCNISPGDTFSEGNTIAILRPGQRTLGIHPKFLSELQGKQATRAIAAGEGVTFGDWK